MKKFALWLLGIVGSSVVLSVVLAVVINKVGQRSQSIFESKELYISFLIFVTVGVLVVLVKYYNNYPKRISKILLKGNEKDKIESTLECVNFQTKEELEENFRIVNYGDEQGEVGIPIQAIQGEDEYEIVLTDNMHSLVIGSTGSGKTTSYIDPSIEIMSNFREHPSLIITDPKGELYTKHKANLERRGYTVAVVDLRNPYVSTKWNPLEKIYVDYGIARNIEKYVEEAGEKRILFGKEYNQSQVKNAMKIEQQKRYDEIYERLNDIATVICPITNKGEPIWESGARNLILAILIGMLEDSQKEVNPLRKDQYNFYNLFKIATTTEYNCRTLCEYFNTRDVLSKARVLSKQALESHEKTRGSYLSTLFDKLNIFTDISICHLTSENEITFSDLDEKPYAIFIQIPDEKETRYKIASMILVDIYKELIAKANSNEGLKLKRNVYFILDEFGNLPKIEKIEQMVTVSRSRGLFFTFVVQSYAQLVKVYDKSIADIIKSNCNIHIFIGTSDLNTTEEFSKRCGNYSIMSRSISEGGKKTGDVSSNTSIKERPLIYPSELRTLNSGENIGNAIVTVFGHNPIKAKFTPSYKCTAYDLNNKQEEKVYKKLFDEMKILYDISANKKTIAEPEVKEKREYQTEEIGLRPMTSQEIKKRLQRILNTELMDPRRQEILYNDIEQGNLQGAMQTMLDCLDFAILTNKTTAARALEDLMEEMTTVSRE